MDLKCMTIPLKSGIVPSKVVLHFRRYKTPRYHFYHSFVTMNPLILYYRRQADRGREDIGPIYITPTFMQRGHGLGSILTGLFRTLRPIIWSGAKSMGKETLRALGREALRTGAVGRGRAGRPDHDQQHCYHQAPTVNQRLLLQLL